MFRYPWNSFEGRSQELVMWTLVQCQRHTRLDLAIRHTLSLTDNGGFTTISLPIMLQVRVGRRKPTKVTECLAFWSSWPRHYILMWLSDCKQRYLWVNWWEEKFECHDIFFWQSVERDPGSNLMKWNLYRFSHGWLYAFVSYPGVLSAYFNK